MSVTFLSQHREVTWEYVKHANGWSSYQLRMAQDEAYDNGFTPAMFLPLDEYIAVKDIRVIQVKRGV